MLRIACFFNLKLEKADISLLKLAFYFYLLPPRIPLLYLRLLCFDCSKHQEARAEEPFGLFLFWLKKTKSAKQPWGAQWGLRVPVGPGKREKKNQG